MPGSAGKAYALQFQAVLIASGLMTFYAKGEPVYWLILRPDQKP